MWMEPAQTPAGRTRRQAEAYSLLDRLLAMLASLFFSIPTALIIWLCINWELTLWWDGFLDSFYLWGSILLFALLAFTAPRLFPTILGGVWNTFIKLWNWW